MIPLASGEQRNAIALPTSLASSACGNAEFFSQYFTIAPMIPIALAARDAKGPALTTFTRAPHFRPASYARTRVSLSSAAFAELIPPPYPGIARSEAM